MNASPRPEPTAPGWRLENSYASLPALFHSRVEPTPVRAPRLVVFNRRLAEDLGLDANALDSDNGAAIFAGNRLPEGSRPIAQAYAGHQFGHFTPLGDGRAILLGEQTAPDGTRFDIQLKGPGPTPYARRGDGRAALGPMLREYIVSEAMNALGIPTTRSLAVAATGETVHREEPLPGAVLTRVAASHIRVGTFQWAAAHQDPAALRALADYALRRHYPELASAASPYLAFFEAILERQAALVAQWLSVGFIHGVMNTDNMAISGETIDYGPCAFMDAYDPATAFSSIDRHGRYAYANQPGIAHWNLARLGETLLPLLDADPKKALERANETLATFEGRFQRHWLSILRAKLGLFEEEAGDRALADSLFDAMAEAKADFANTFRALGAKTSPDENPFAETPLASWRERWQARLGRQRESPAEARALMRLRNPAVIPRNHKVEEALTAAVANDDLEPMRRLLVVLSQPFDYTHIPSEYVEPPAPTDRPYQTFCGT